MNNRLYKLMNWPFIEEVIYSECDHPQDLLGPHTKGTQTLVQAYFPGASAVSILWNGPEGKMDTRMEMADEDGFFAQLLPAKDAGQYQYSVTYEIRKEDSKTFLKKNVKCGDPYRHSQILSRSDLEKFNAGNLLNAQEKLGAHVMTHEGEVGVHFSVWAPNVMRVRVIGDFNNWDGRVCQMKRLGETGVFELFVPGAKAGDAYLFECKMNASLVQNRLDPYATRIRKGDKLVSIVAPESKFSWSDKAFVGKRKNLHSEKTGISIYEVCPSQVEAKEGPEALLRRIAAPLIEILKEQKFTHAELMPVFLGSEADRLGSQPISFFALDPQYGTAEDLQYFVNELHKAGFGVILNWAPSNFGTEETALRGFDGTCLYGHQDPRRGYCQDLGSFLFNYARPEVASFILSSGLYLVKNFHADGIRVEGVARMLYLDYAKGDGQWLPNLYGGNENLEAMELLRRFNTELKKEEPHVLSIAEDSSAHPAITDPVSEGGLGFDMKWNYAFSEDYLQFAQLDPFFRGQHMNELKDGFVYAFVDKYVQALSKPAVGAPLDQTLQLMPGTDEQKKANLRLGLGYLYAHPGRKLLHETTDPNLQTLIQDLNELYLKQPALHETDYDPAAFEWLSTGNTEQCALSYIRKTADPEEMLIVVCNFSGVAQNITTGVPFEGKYKEIFNTDAVFYGGTGLVNRTTKRATDKQSDGRAQSITIKMGALSMAIFQFIPYTEEELAKVITERIRKNTPLKKKK